jgi:hypothetical protein
MPKIKTEQLQEGMVVAAEVKNMDNMLLLPAGCKLTQKHINILEAWGVPEVTIENAGQAPEPVNPLAQMSPADLARLTVQTKALFWELDLGNPVQAAVFNGVLRRRARKGQHA